MKNKRPAILAQSIGALLALAAVAPHASANQIWDGGGTDDFWSTSANWGLNTLPNFNASLTFGGGVRLAPVNSTQASVAGLTFSASAGAFTLTGTGVGDSITLGGNITNSSANLQTISFGTMTLTGNRNLNADTSALTVDSAIVLGANTLTATATNDIRLNGSISGTGGLVKDSVGTLFLAGTNTYSGPTTLNDGFLSAQTSGALSPNSTFIVQGSTTLDLAGNDSTIGGLNDGGSTTGRVVNSSAGFLPTTPAMSATRPWTPGGWRSGAAWAAPS
jgi:autotransporter-associated beta strand protein